MDLEPVAKPTGTNDSLSGSKDASVHDAGIQFGFLVLTTSAGIMDHEEARRKHVGGKILGFFF